MTVLVSILKVGGAIRLLFENELEGLESSTLV